MYESSNGEIKEKKRLNNEEKAFLTIYTGMMGIGLIIFSIVGQIWDRRVMVAFVPGIFWLVLNAFWASSYYAEYEFNKDGVFVKYPFQSKKLISWSEFQQVCVCYSDYNKSGGAFVVIACIKKGEKKNLYGCWKTTNPFHHRSVLTMDYTDELYKEITKQCPYEVVDLRKTRTYRL